MMQRLPHSASSPTHAAPCSGTFSTLCTTGTDTADSRCTACKPGYSPVTDAMEALTGCTARCLDSEFWDVMALACKPCLTLTQMNSADRYNQKWWVPFDGARSCRPACGLEGMLLGKHEGRAVRKGLLFPCQMTPPATHLQPRPFPFGACLPAVRPCPAVLLVTAQMQCAQLALPAWWPRASQGRYSCVPAQRANTSAVPPSLA